MTLSKLKNSNLEFKQIRLSNGLTVIAERNPNSASVSMGFFVKTGARDEDQQDAGVSHFLEHMVFKGTEKRNAIEINFGFSDVGAQANAFTSEENTVFYFTALPDYIEPAFEILADMMHPALDESEFLMEKGVILDEIALYKDKPFHVLLENSLKLFFEQHPAGSSVLGSKETITALPVERMRAYHQARYSPSNMVLVASGDVDWDSYLRLAEKFCGEWTGAPVERNKPKFSFNPEIKNIEQANLNQCHTVWMCPAPSFNHELRYAGGILANILGDMSGSKFFWKLIASGLAENAGCDLELFDDVGVFFSYISTSPENLANVSEIIETELATAALITQEQLDRAKTKIKTRLVLQGESSMRRLVAVGMDWIYRAKYTTLGAELANYNKITLADLNEYLEKFPLNNFSKVSMTGTNEKVSELNN